MSAPNKCWTAAELYAECDRLAKLVGTNAFVSFSVSRSEERYRPSSEKACSVVIYPNGLCAGGPQYFRSDVIGEAFAKAAKFCTTAHDRYSAAVIRRMALAVIDITDRLGACSDLNLKADKFTASEIATFHVEACEAASRMSGNAPFAVVMSVSTAA